MRKKQVTSPMVLRRPQLWVALITLLLVGGGLLPRPFSTMEHVHPSVLHARTTSSVVAEMLHTPVPLPAPQATRSATETPDCVARACLALTFDDGPHAVYTSQILDILERHHARATFFVVGSHVHGNESLLQRMFVDQDEIGNHSWGHPDFTTLTPAQMEQQVAQTQAAVLFAGVPAPTLFRPPYGAVNPVVRSHVSLTMALWNIDPEDWKARSAQEIITRVNATAKPGGIVELHDIHSHTVEALDPLLTNLEQQYQFVTVSELLNLPPGQHGTYYGR